MMKYEMDNDVPELDVREKIAAGFYESKLPVASRVLPKPQMLSKRADELTDLEVINLTRVKKEYEAAVAERKANAKARSADSVRLSDLFRLDVEVENGTRGHPKADKLWNMAYERGHSGGFSEILSEYEDIVGLVK